MSKPKLESYNIRDELIIELKDNIKLIQTKLECTNLSTNNIIRLNLLIDHFYDRLFKLENS